MDFLAIQFKYFTPLKRVMYKMDTSANIGGAAVVPVTQSVFTP
jgi:hypothetical protein